ncbi:MAG: hypothetical protein D6820_03475 [Lentisphaerae bacterium]|nr:MAG: hypothetical protein D6820_03475 [Lentisphaerota bacterium]
MRKFSQIAQENFLFCLTLAALTAAMARAEKPVTTVRLVDGTAFPARFLFRHPNCPRVVLRHPRYASAQSLPLAIIHKIGDRTFNAKRPLSPREKSLIKLNGLWVTDVSSGQIGRYAKETWEYRPLIVWAHPGTSGNAMEAKNWLDENGRPLSRSPWQLSVTKRGRKTRRRGFFNGDILLPGAPAPYRAIQPGKRDYLEPYRIRHLTLEENSSYAIRYTITGNLWMKVGSHLGENTQTGGLGSEDANKHTVARFCDPPETILQRRGKKGFKDLKAIDRLIAEDPQLLQLLARAKSLAISHWVHIRTGVRGSLEIVGISGGAADRLTLYQGTLIISENSYIGNGNRASFFTLPGTTLILLDGAGCGCMATVQRGNRATYAIAGTLMFGTPDHPLKRDLIFSIAHTPLDQLSPDAKAGQRGAGAGFILAASGKIRVYSRDPQHARVIIRPRHRRLPVSKYAIPRKDWKSNVLDSNGLPTSEFWKRDYTPKAVTAVLAGDTTGLDAVVFDGFYEHGLVVPARYRRTWKHVTFGSRNLAPGDQIIAPPGLSSGTAKR